ncbi:MAG: hypothetical protein PVH85_01250 [Desulfobacterales bacterium]|jgi:hypothetical protein
MKFAAMLICVFFINAIGQTAQATTINSDDIFYDNDVIITPPGSTLRAHDQSGMKQFGYFDNKWAVLASTNHRPRATGAEISDIDTGGDVGLIAGSNPILTYFDKLVSWIKDTYRARVALDNYGATRLLLLSFGLVGLLGIRRKLKKSRSAQISSEKEHWILGKNKKDWILRKN